MTPAMPRRRKLLLALLACGLLALAAFFLLRESEPSYNGKSLSAWLVQINDRSPNENQRLEARSEAADAIETIGTNALPYLLKWITRGEAPLSPFKSAAYVATEKVSALKKITSLRTWAFIEYERILGIPDAFEALGPKAIPAIPELAHLANTSIGQSTPYFATRALTKIGSPALPALSDILTNQHSLNRAAALLAVTHLGRDASPLIPPVIQCLDDHDPDIVAQAATALGEVGQPQLVVPALTNLLLNLKFESRTNFNVAFKISTALQQYRLQASNAAPALIRYIEENPSEELRRFFLIRSVVEISDSPEILVPFLAGCLNDTNTFVADWTAGRLGEFGPAASPALPALTNALLRTTASEPNYQITLSNAIYQIASPPTSASPTKSGTNALPQPQPEKVRLRKSPSRTS